MVGTKARGRPSVMAMIGPVEERGENSEGEEGRPGPP